MTTDTNDTGLIDWDNAWVLLHRLEDISGISKTGDVAYLLNLGAHGALLYWNTGWATMGWYPTFQAAVDIHGHHGSTKFVPLSWDRGADHGHLRTATTLHNAAGLRALHALRKALMGPA